MNALTPLAPPKGAPIGLTKPDKPEVEFELDRLKGNIECLHEVISQLCAKLVPISSMHGVPQPTPTTPPSCQCAFGQFLKDSNAEINKAITRLADAKDALCI